MFARKCFPSNVNASRIAPGRFPAFPLSAFPRAATFPRMPQLRAIRMLILSTAFWGISFPTMKALVLAHEQLLPGAGSLFTAGTCLVYRFGFATFIMLLVSARTVRTLDRDERLHGLGIGIFGGVGILLQMDALAHTAASTSAFLTQIYVLILPLWFAVKLRRRPAPRLLIACAFVIVGVAILAGVRWGDFRLGRGELETLLASVIFTGQILWLERPRFAKCRVNHSTLVMFATMALASLPAALATTQRASDWWTGYATLPTAGFVLILTTLCTLGAYVLMNRWQRHVGATAAGLIYCGEPIFASVFALFLPAWFSAWAGVDYANEQLTVRLVVGGALILGANVLAQWPQRPVSPEKLR
jgi:drug/metabolite transporter (DMT)-like permease